MLNVPLKWARFANQQILNEKLQTCEEIFLLPETFRVEVDRLDSEDVADISPSVYCVQVRSASATQRIGMQLIPNAI